MSRSTFFYALWCTLILALFTAAAMTGYSPFADGGRSVFARGAGGPHHK